MGDRKWIIWGAGKNGKRIYELMNSCGEYIALFVDENKNLHGKNIGNVLIGTLNEIDCIFDYMICVTVQGSFRKIRDYLMEQFHICETQIVHYATCIFEMVEHHLNLFDKYSLYKKDASKKTTILFECGSGLGLGGIETWNLTFGRMLLKRGYSVKYLLPEKSVYNVMDPCVWIKDCTSFKEGWNINFLNKAVKQIIDQLPCVFIANHLNILVLAAYIAKKLYPSKINIVSIVHGGNESILEWNYKIEPYVDIIIGVAENGICNKLRNFGISSDKIIRVVCPIACPEHLNRNYSEENQPIKLGYAARLEINDRDKRVDYLIPLIEKLEKSKVKYVLSVAGKGDYEWFLKEFVRKYKLEDHIKVLGFVNRDEMPDFWSKQDIFINMSDSEGNCMSMLEAMAQGNVPVLTDVSGVRDSITDGENGFIVNCGDMDGIVEKIIFLYKNRELLSKMGTKAYEKIKIQYNEHAMLNLFETHVLRLKVMKEKQY